MNDERIKQLQVSRSIKDIVDNFVEFEYNSEEGYVICNLCVPEPCTSSTASTHGPADNGMFMYNSEIGMSFSVVELLVSRYETHFHKKRGLNEKNAMDEMEISENGPSEFRAEKLLVVAMDKYWKKETKSGQWHFTRQ